MSRFIKSLGGLFQRQSNFRVVGRDAHGNSFLQSVRDPRVREVQFRERDVVAAHDSEVHPLWNSWLRHVRTEPPSDSEVAAVRSSVCRAARRPAHCWPLRARSLI